MKLVSFQHEDRTSIGVAVAHGVVDIGARLGIPCLSELLRSNRVGELHSLGDGDVDHAFDAVRLLPPIPHPSHIFCIGTNYADHLLEVQQAGISRPAPKYPAVFTRYPETLVAHQNAMWMPKVSSQMDFEGELAVIIGKPGKDIHQAHALEHVAGYACFNDGSVRDWQFHSHQVWPGKNFSSSGAFGPWLVTADEVPEPGNLDIELRVNGVPMQHSNTRHLIFAIPYLISYLSTILPLQPGDVIATGTPAGVGFSRTPPLFLKPGDRCEVIIQRVGILENDVIAEPTA